MDYMQCINPTVPVSPSGYRRSVFNLNITLPKKMTERQMTVEFETQGLVSVAPLDKMSPRFLAERREYLRLNIDYFEDVGWPTGDCATHALHTVLEEEDLKLSYGLIAESLIVEKQTVSNRDELWYLHHCSPTHRNFMNVLKYYSAEPWFAANLEPFVDLENPLHSELGKVSTWLSEFRRIDYGIVRVANHVFPFRGRYSPDLEEYGDDLITAVIVPDRFTPELRKAHRRLKQVRQDMELQVVME